MKWNERKRARKESGPKNRETRPKWVKVVVGFGVSLTHVCKQIAQAKASNKHIINSAENRQASLLFFGSFIFSLFLFIDWLIAGVFL